MSAVLWRVTIDGIRMELWQSRSVHSHLPNYTAAFWLVNEPKHMTISHLGQDLEDALSLFGNTVRHHRRLTG
jgi:hypothetical protein